MGTTRKHGGDRGPKIPADGLRMIREEALKFPRVLRRELAEHLRTSFEQKGWPLPEVETLEKKISEVRNKRDELDKPWSLVSLPSHAIAPEALPYVLKVWARSLTINGRPTHPEQDNEENDADEEHLILRIEFPRFKLSPHTFTIRHALWVARLYTVVIDAHRPLKELSPNDWDWLWATAENLSNQERVLEMEHEYPPTRREAWYFWLNDMNVYRLLPGEPNWRDIEAQVLAELEIDLRKHEAKGGAQ